MRSISAWVEEIGEGLTELKVRVRHPAVEHRVRMKDFRRWLELYGKSPAECSAETAALGHYPRWRIGAVIRIGPAGWSYKDWDGIVYSRIRPRDSTAQPISPSSSTPSKLTHRSTDRRRPRLLVIGFSGFPAIHDSNSRRSSGADSLTSAMRPGRTRATSSRAWMSWLVPTGWGRCGCSFLGHLGSRLRTGSGSLS